ncbi:MAG: 50S ribosomal protein L3 N(5)-glutamine methyltransferase [Alphaproteobacteria bacterium]|nr:50S ribosomal protein L3 N(5)-glutamine methyltransferase [Alphaproteobacteria bacterium]
MTNKKAPTKKPGLNELHTVRDFIRYALTRFNASDLFYGHGTFNAQEEAVFIVMEALHMPLGDLDPWWDARLTAEEQKKVLTLIEKRIKTRKPAAYLLGRTWLQDLPFYVDERVIVPRSYIAELMVSGLSGIEDYPLVPDPYTITSVLDLCTGSGCLAIIAAHVFPNAAVDAVELSPDAMDVAEKNVAFHQMEGRITLYKGDLFNPLKNKTYDLIITNPPYVAPTSMKNLPPEYAHEPKMALAGGGKDGMKIVHRILDNAAKHLNPGGGLLCEIGDAQEDLEATRPDLPYLWLDTANSAGEVFWLTREDLEAV